MRMYVALMVLFFCASSSVICAASIERSLPVSTFITANETSSQLEFFADKYIFQSEYDFSQQTFYPLTIAFGVRSVNGQSISYDLFMSHLGAQCDGESLAVNVVTVFDGEQVVLNEKHRFAGVENDHDIVLLFPAIPQSGTSRQCRGHIGFIAEMVV